MSIFGKGTPLSIIIIIPKPMIRSLLLITACILFSAKSKGQTNTNFNYNLGIRAFSYGQTPSILNDYVNKNARKYLTGLLLKFNDNQLAYRLGFNFYTKDNYSLTGTRNEKLKGRYRDYGLTLGFERDLSLSNFKPFFGGDIGFIHSNFKGIRTTGVLQAPLTLATLKNGLSLSPLFGVKYTFIPRFYLSIEAAVCFDYSFNRVESTPQLPASRVVTHYSKGEFLTSPVAYAGLHYNFGITD